MDFNVNHPILFVIVGAIIALVLAQSVFFLVRAVKRAKQLVEGVQFILTLGMHDIGAHFIIIACRRDIVELGGTADAGKRWYLLQVGSRSEVTTANVRHSSQDASHFVLETKFERFVEFVEDE